MVCSFKETHVPAILRQKAILRRNLTSDERWWSRHEDRKSVASTFMRHIQRMLVAAVTEPILILWNTYTAIIYGIFYMHIVEHVIVFENLRGWSPGLTSLSYSGIGIGCVLCICLEPVFQRFLKSCKVNPETGIQAPEAMVVPVCIGAFLVPLGHAWFAWTSTPEIHWMIPILAGVPFGWGICSVFVYANSYVLRTFCSQALPALTGNTVLRSIAAGCLPLATSTMYKTLDPHWAGSILVLLEIVCIPIPFVFYIYGERMRKKSRLIRSIEEDQAQSEY